MDSALLIHRLQFAFTVTFHYLFPQLTMGLAPLIVVLKTLAIKKNDDTYNQAARFWAKIFGINFAIGVVTGIPMEFQFGTNWSHFSRFAGGVIGQTLAMEGGFSFFLESTFLGLFLYGEKRLSRGMHLFAAFMVFVGSWASGFFIIATDAWMQNPVGYQKAADGSLQLSSFWALVLNPWAWLQYAHNMSGAVITGSFVMAAVGAFYLLGKRHVEQARIFVRVGVIAGLIVSVLQVFPTGDRAGKMVAEKQPLLWPPWKRCSIRRRRSVGDYRPTQHGHEAPRQSHHGSEDAELPDLPTSGRPRCTDLASSLSATGLRTFRCFTTPTTLWWASGRCSSLPWELRLCCSGAGNCLSPAGCSGFSCSCFRFHTSPTPRAG